MTASLAGVFVLGTDAAPPGDIACDNGVITAITPAATAPARTISNLEPICA